jgi:hypothetical protein
MGKIIVSLILISAAFLTGCGLSALENRSEMKPPTPGEAPSEVTPTEIESTSPSQTVKLPDGVVIQFQRSGGLAGVMESWLIYSDGRVVSNQGKTVSVTSQQVSELLQKIEQLGFFALPARYMPLNKCCDLFEYTLSVQMAEKTHQVVFYDFDPEVPQALWEIMAAVQALIDESAH